MRHYIKYLSIILIVLLHSCSSSRKTSRTVVTEGPFPAYVTDYINRYGALAVREMQRTGIPASITLAQGMLESDYGRSILARKGNNHFGIKCHNNWTGDKIYYDDNRRGECFRAYASAEDSYRDHSDFLVTGSRYSDLFRLDRTDYRGWAHGLKKAGYATDPNYSALLIKKIDEYGLHAYDSGNMPVALSQHTAVSKEKTPVTISAPASAAARPYDTAQVNKETEAPIKVISLSKGRIQKNNNVEFIIAKEGDTYESLAEEFQLLSWEITRYNDLTPGADIQPGQIIYLQPKRSRAAEGNQMHIVKEGETMIFISQKYAVKLSALYKMNMMAEGTECIPGQKVRLR